MRELPTSPFGDERELWEQL